MKVVRSKTVGVEIHNLDIREMSEAQYSEIERLFHSELLLLFPHQAVDPVAFARLITKIGPIGNMPQCFWTQAGDRIQPIHTPMDPFKFPIGSPEYPVQRVTGMYKNGKPTGIFGQGTLDWHCNINGIYWNPGVGLQAAEGVHGSSTAYLDTTAAFRDLTPDLQDRCRKVIGRFEYAPEVWAEGMLEEQYRGMTAVKKPFYFMPLVNKNKAGREGLYFHFLNSCTFPKDPDLFPILKEHCFKEKYIQRVLWEVGDIHLSHQILTLHKREQDDPEILARRVLHRYTFTFSDPDLESAREWWDRTEL